MYFRGLPMKRRQRDKETKPEISWVSYIKRISLDTISFAMNAIFNFNLANTAVRHDLFPQRASGTAVIQTMAGKIWCPSVFFHLRLI